MHLSRSAPFGVCALPVSFWILFSGCPTKEVYLQDIEVTGPVNQIPVHVTDDVVPGSLVISPRLSFGASARLDGRVEGHSKVNAAGTFQVDTVRNTDGSLSLTETPGVNTYEFQGRNLHWRIPSVSAGIDIDYAAFNSLALIAGLSHASSSGRSFWGGHAGIALVKEETSSALRLEAGFQWQSLSYIASSLVVTTEPSPGVGSKEVMFYRDAGRQRRFDPFASLTFNSKQPGWPLDFFFQAGVSWQSVFDFEPEFADVNGPFSQIGDRDYRGQHTTAFFTITPGVYVNVGLSSRLLAGARVLLHDFEGANRSALVVPMVQMDLRW